jgi:hypothetical protein
VFRDMSYIVRSCLKKEKEEEEEEEAARNSGKILWKTEVDMDPICG